jgi:hypothetical protein
LIQYSVNGMLAEAQKTNSALAKCNMAIGASSTVSMSVGAAVVGLAAVIALM